MRATIKDIAERVGVSKSLVSMYLNNHPLSARIAEKTKKRIREAVQEMICFSFQAPFRKRMTVIRQATIQAGGVLR